MIKAKFGHRLRSKSLTEQINEARTRLVANGGEADRRSGERLVDRIAQAILTGPIYTRLAYRYKSWVL